MKKIAILVVLILIFSSCSANKNMQPFISPAVSEPRSVLDLQASEREEICFDFIENKMVTQQGGIRTNYLDTLHNANLATGAEVLSESMGLIMLYAAGIQDEALFKRSMDFVEEYLDTGNTISYRYGKSPYYVNAFIDDIRIIRALILAGDAFNGKYLDTAKTYADRLYDTNVIDGYVYDMYDDEYGNNNDFITLCYIDLYTIQLLKNQDKKWDKVFENMLEITKGGYISNAFPLYESSYSYASKSYRQGDINMIEAVLTALNLARIDQCPQETIRYLKTSIENGAVYGSYTHDGKRKNDTESTAIYAICALIAKEVDDEDMYNKCIDRMNSFQVMDKKSEVYGAFADSVTLDLYSFDNLMALLAYRQR